MEITGLEGAEVSAVLVLVIDTLLLEDFEVLKVVELEEAKFEVLEITDEVLVVAEPEPFPVDVGVELPPVLVGVSPPSYALELGREQEPSRFWLIEQEPVCISVASQLCE